MVLNGYPSRSFQDTLPYFSRCTTNIHINASSSNKNNAVHTQTIHPHHLRTDESHEAITTTVVNSTKEMERNNACEQTKSTMNTSNPRKLHLSATKFNPTMMTPVQTSRTKPSVFASVSPFPCPDLQQERCCRRTEQTHQSIMTRANLQATNINSTNIQPAAVNASSCSCISICETTSPTERSDTC